MRRNIVALLYFAINVLDLIELNIAVISGYCYHRLNTSNCYKKPTPVFTYYKPGSRCEIEYWRGCPTLNKFENEYECVDQCIGKLAGGFGNELDDDDINKKKSILSFFPKNGACKEPIDLKDCAKDPIEVFTFDSNKGKCVKVKWKGCKSLNKFDDKSTCKLLCIDKFKKLKLTNKEEQDSDEDESGMDGNGDKEKERDDDDEDIDDNKGTAELKHKGKKKGKSVFSKLKFSGNGLAQEIVDLEDY